MTWWSLQPRDPLMVRDGRPFGDDAESARTQGFPPPSVIAGALRTRVGFAARGPAEARFGLTPDAARAIAVTGPILADAHTAWLPAPADCVLFDGPGGWTRHRLAPGAPWPDGAHGGRSDLRPVEPVADLPKDKPAAAPPAFWRADALRAWLSAPAAHDHLDPSDTLPALPRERRVHLMRDPKTGTAVDGKLFSTEGLRLAGDLHLRVRCDDARLRPGLLPMGGERRLAHLTPAHDPAWPAPALAGPLARVLLLTPVAFPEGAVPATLGGRPVIAAAVGRPVVVSGWDLAVGGPKPTRRLAPAGSVYWVDLAGADADAWTAQVHWRSVAPDAQDGLDGFGLAVVGVAS